MAYHVLNLGAGVQSTTLALLFAEEKILDSSGHPVNIHCAIFADTQEEPDDPGFSVREHLMWLKNKLPFPIITTTAGKLGYDLSRGCYSTGQRFASIPAFTFDGKKTGIVRRQCTSEYKIRPIEKAIREQVIRIKKGGRVPPSVRVYQYVGISLDEVGRMIKAKKNANHPRWATMVYPLCEQLMWTRQQCREYLRDRVPHRVPRSACVFCPYHSNEEWQNIKSRNGADWRRAVEVDRMLRVEGSVVNRNLDAKLYLHRSCKPLDEVDFSTDKNGDKNMAGECQGMCGN